MSRKKCDVYRSLRLILSGPGVELTQTYAFAKKRLNYALSYDFEIFKGMSHNLEQKMCGLPHGVYRKNESATAIPRAWTVLKGG